MKRMKSFLALMVALLLAANCVFALAEGTTMDVSGVAIGNVQISVNDELVSDLSGLTLKLDAGQSDGGSRLAARATVMGGDEVAAQAVIAGGEEQNKFALNVTGMSKPVTLDAAVLQQLFSEEGMQQLMDQLLAELSDEERAAVEEMIAAITELASEEGLDGLTSAYQAYMEKVNEIMANDMTEGDTAAHEFLYSGETKDAESYVIDVPAEDFQEIMTAACEFYDSIPAFMKLVNALNKLDGETAEITSFSDVMSEVEMPAVTLYAEAYSATDGSEVEMSYVITMDGEDLMYLTMVIAEDGADNILTFNVSLADEDETSFTMSFIESPNEVLDGVSDYSFVLSGNEGTADEFTAVLWYSPDEDYDFMVGGQVDADGSKVGLAYGTGAEMKSVAFYGDDDMSIEAGWVAASETGAADTLYLSTDDGEGTVIYISADMTHYTETISVDEIDAILNAEGVDVLTIDDAALDTLATELSSGMTNALIALVNNVPALSESAISTLIPTEATDSAIGE